MSKNPAFILAGWPADPGCDCDSAIQAGKCWQLDNGGASIGGCPGCAGDEEMRIGLGKTRMIYKDSLLL